MFEFFPFPDESCIRLKDDVDNNCRSILIRSTLAIFSIAFYAPQNYSYRRNYTLQIKNIHNSGSVLMIFLVVVLPTADENTIKRKKIQNRIKYFIKRDRPLRVFGLISRRQ